MTQLNQVYKCKICGNIVEVVHPASGRVVCCGQLMKLYTANTVDAAKEKHIPVIEKIDKGYKVTVGSVIHPMEGGHYIEWIEVLADDRVLRRYLKPGNEPVAIFYLEAQNISARIYCNLHGLWQAEK